MLLLLFLLFGMAAEFLTARDFDGNYWYINILFACYFGIGVYFISPLFKTTRLRILGKDAIIAVITTALLLYIVYGLVYYSIHEFKGYVPAVLGGVSFVAFAGSCFYTTIFHQHPKKIYLFVVGVCYFVVCIGYLVYQLLLPFNWLMGVVNTAEIIAQFTFIVFLIHRKQMLTETNWYI